MGFNVEQLFDDIKVGYRKKEYSHEGTPCVRYELDKCFFDESHANNDACIFQYGSGAIVYKCQHDSCKDKAWKDVRTHIENELGVSLGKYWSQPPSKDKQQETEPLQFTTCFDICANPVERKSIITGFLDEKDQTIISGNGGVGKSMFIFYLAFYLASVEASDDMLFGKFLVPPQKRTSLFIQSENNLGQVGLRLNRMAGSDPKSREALNRIISPVINGDVLTTGRTFQDTIFQQYIIDLIHKVEDQRGSKVDLLFFDPLISFISLDENNSVSMRKDLDGVTQISLATGITPVIVHHNKKDGNGYRGSSAISDWARNLISLTPELISDGERDVKAIKVKHEKCNNFAMFDPFILRMMDDNRFSCIDSAMSTEAAKQCREIIQALTDLGGKADSQTQLANAYHDVSGIGVSTSKRHIGKAVEAGIINSEIDGKKHSYTLKE